MNKVQIQGAVALCVFNGMLRELVILLMFIKNKIFVVRAQGKQNHSGKRSSGTLIKCYVYKMEN